MWGEVWLPLQTHGSALVRVPLGVLARKKAKEKEGGGGREKGLREQEGHGCGRAESQSSAG